MPSLVFVRDAQERPLMPMSAAYARMLLQQGKARLRPHPAFTIVELTRVVDAPTLRPVLIGLALRDRRVDLQVLIDQVRARPISFSILVECPSRSRSIHSRRRPWQPQETPAGHTLLGLAHSQLRQMVDALDAVVASLQQLLPVSHWAVLPLRAQTALSLQTHRRIRHRLEAVFSSLSREHPAHEIYLSSASNSLTLPQVAQTLLAGAGNFSPIVVARVSDAQEPFNRPSRLPPTRDRALHDQKHIHRRNKGQVCSIRSEGRVLTGVVGAVYSDDHFVLRVPVLQGTEHLQWRLITVPGSTPIRIWPSSNVALLPLNGTFQS